LPVYPYNEVRPCLGERVFVAPGAVVVGDVEVGDDCSFWFHSSFWFDTVARGDVHRIRIGAGTNVQDGSVLHVTHETHPLTIGKGVVIGHEMLEEGAG
jgi:carbonic anhydrase/acetyltransferase-like protein (isoleucine patch superfamily)